MPFPPFWPPRPASGRRALRVYETGTCTAAFADNAFLFRDVTSANTIDPTPYLAPGDTTTAVQIGGIAKGGSPMGGRRIAEDVAPPQHENPPATQQASPWAMAWAKRVRVYNAGPGGLEVSFDGTNVHGFVPDGESVVFEDRYEAGISLRHVGAGLAVYHVEAW